MKNLQYFVMLFLGLFLASSCSKDTEPQACPQTENISMKINGEEKEFEMQGWGIEINKDGTGHTLQLVIASGVFSPSQDSYSISMLLPYKKTGENIIEKFKYLRVQNATSAGGDFVPGNLQSTVTVNSSTCISMSFSGSLTIDGDEIIISEGIISHTYPKAFGSF